MTSIPAEKVATDPSSVRPVRAWRNSDAAKGLTLISPPVLFAIALLAIPIISTITYSFWTQNYLDIDKTITFSNYYKAWTEPIYRLLMTRSVVVSSHLVDS